MRSVATGRARARAATRADVAPGGEWLGWFETPAGTTHLRIGIPTAGLARRIATITVHSVSERDPKCHPLANVPRWSMHQPPWPIQRLVLPAHLLDLTPLLEGLDVQIVSAPQSQKELARAARGSTCVLDPAWVDKLGLTFAEVERIAANSWLIVDLATLARLVTQAGIAETTVVTHHSRHGLMSARVEYADVPTRGFALQDVLPYSVRDARGRFAVRALKADRAWRNFADEVGFATLLSGETPWGRKHADVLSAIRAVGGGELLATDLPWLVAGVHGPLVAPRVAAHLLRAHLGLPVADHLQYWNRWGAGDTLVRDIADLSSRCPPLRAVRWASPDRHSAHLGISLQSLAAPPSRHVLIRTGRMDQRDPHDGLPAEPLMIFMKWLAREAREQTPWAREHLARQTVTWQFDTAEGLRYAVQFDAAEELPEVPVAVVAVRLRPADGATGGAGTPTLAASDGLHGDGAFELLDEVSSRLRNVIENW